MVLNPRESGEYIAGIAKHVKINQDGVQRAAELVLKGFLQQDFNLNTWWKSHELNPKNRILPFTLDWIFFVDTLNFSFWSEEGRDYKITYQGKTYTGYWSLCAAVNRSIEEGFDITSPSNYSNISLEKLKHIFRSDTGVEIPLLDERHRILLETGKCLVEKFNSTFATCVDFAKNNAEELLKIVLLNFASYRDEASIDGQSVSFYKRAQILIGDIWVCFEGQGIGAFHDIEKLTIFADYRVPQALVYLEAMEYSDELLKTLKEDKLIDNGGRFEVEIRGCTIWTTELIWKVIKEKQKNGEVPKDLIINAILIDNYLWQYRRDHAEEMEHIPFHKVRCIYY
ncbi:hypothetical protein JTE90_003775 [Oedothorax gibbosus]|uniref:Queuosine 5'-phosphate N-glycosylase/hydrolase n=1 Tax=Oedothorax gibbosus TaxID=931172 RepID=A0AAV6VBN7_9ARAC|nr:hypothetical protein JTE90_003775 [Oedothorax gibbosus]